MDSTYEDEWEDGTFSGSNREDDHPDILETDVFIEFDDSSASGERRKIRRPSAEDKVPQFYSVSMFLLYAEIKF